jgi:hypothetical protein
MAILSAKDCPEPTTFADACRIPHAPQWREAMQQELDSLQSNDTGSLVDLPPRPSRRQ